MAATLRTGRANLAEMTLRAVAHEPLLREGEVWLVGAGPSDPSMLTVQALAALGQADVVVHDALVDRRILELISPATERIFVGKRGGRPSIAQKDITALLIRLSREMRRVVRLKGGHPCVFAHGAEETLALAKAGIRFRVIEGLTSGLAALTAAGIPATIRGVNHAVTLVAGHHSESAPAHAPSWSSLARSGQPLVVYMALKNIAAITRELLAGGLPNSTPAAMIAAVGTAAERVIVAPLEAIPQAVLDAELSPPAILVVGGIVPHRAKLQALAAACSGHTYP